MSGRDGLSRTKAELWAHLKDVRAAMGERERLQADHAIARAVLATRAWRQAEGVYTYLSFVPEVDTRELIRAAFSEGKRVCLPRVVGPHAMRWFWVEDLTGLEVSRYGIAEPRVEGDREADPSGSAADVALVPGLAFDRAGNRLGYGGGFYDVFLDGFKGTSLGLCRAGSHMERLAFVEQHDRAVDIVVTGGSKDSFGASQGEVWVC